MRYQVAYGTLECASPTQCMFCGGGMTHAVIADRCATRGPSARERQLKLYLQLRVVSHKISTINSINRGTF